MLYPLRKENGLLLLDKYHFGIKKRKYLFALMDFVTGYAAEDSARRVSALCGEKVTASMLKETFRPNLFGELVAFPGDDRRISLQAFCRSNGTEHLFDRGAFSADAVGWQERTMILFYLREVFDLRPAIAVVSETEYGLD